VTAALARRDEGCASDLLMDRWLLGEIPGSDEGRRLERHVKQCTGCAARFQALRSLYGNRPLPKAEAPLPPLSAPAPVLPPEHAAVLQVVILRDGLLVGTEVFTAGRYTVGSDPSCALRLEDLVSLHAAVSLSGERVALEAAGGPVFVNGFRATSCELRPIDEVAVGPYVLRARVINERWRRPKLEVVRAEEPVRAAPAVVSMALKLELFWGDRRVNVQVVDRPGDLSDFGITSVVEIDGGWVLDGLRVAHGEAARFHVGHLVCVATSVRREPPVAPRPLGEWPWLVMSIAAGLSAAVVAFGVYGANLELPDFTPKPIDPAIVHVVMKPRPKPKPVEIAKLAPKVAPVKTPPVKGPPRGLRPLDKLIRGPALKDLFAAVDRLPAAGSGKKQPLIAGIGGLPRATPGGPGLGFHSDSLGTGIGAKGFAGAGGLKTRDVGRGAVAGVVRSSGRQAAVPKSSALSRDEIAKVINAHIGEISACYERVMMQAGPFAGSMLLEWTISAPGTVTKCGVKRTDIREAAFGTCVLSKLKSWRFPAAPGPSEVTFPLHLGHQGY